ncbi:MAG TPA: hypothetical protein VI319_03495 [Burkholderiales bacterium]
MGIDEERQTALASEPQDKLLAEERPDFHGSQEPSRTERYFVDFRDRNGNDMVDLLLMLHCCSPHAA